jgi:maltokinase
VRDLLVEEDLHADEVGADFASEAERLGEAMASVHADLATVFDTAVLGPAELADLSAQMRSRLDAAVEVVPELAASAAAIERTFSALGALTTPIPAQRIHGDLHLAQTLRTVKGWKIIDFEGEPMKTLAERVRLDSPLRDVAGMLRSFDYAAGATLREFGTGDQLSYRADEWSRRNRHAFLDGYAARAGLDVDDVTVVLHAYEVDKAVYEAVYEARNRPSWLAIPVNAIARLASEE